MEENGQEANLTDKWVLRNMKPAMVLIYAVGVMAVISQGNLMEAKEDKPKQEETDVVLEEEQAKKQSGN